MSRVSIFSDQRMVDSDEVSEQADQALAEGDLPEAQRLWAKAAELEASYLRELDGEDPQVYTFLALDCAFLWARAREFDRAVQHCEDFLTRPERLTEHGVKKLTSMAGQYKARKP